MQQLFDALESIETSKRAFLEDLTTVRLMAVLEFNPRKRKELYLEAKELYYQYLQTLWKIEMTLENDNKNSAQSYEKRIN